MDLNLLALKLEILARHLLTIQDQPNYQRDYGQIEVLIFPLVNYPLAKD